MNQASFIIPGLLLPQAAARALPAEALDALRRMAGPAPAGEFEGLVVTDGPETGSVHLALAWRALTGRKLPYERAPFTWLAADGPMVYNEIWRLRLCRRGPEGELLPLSSPPGPETVEVAADALALPLRREGFTLQRCGEALYASRRDDWGAALRDWRTLAGHAARWENDVWPSEKLAGGEGGEEAAARARAVMTSLPETLAGAGIRNAGEPVDALWMDGGGRPRDFNPPTRVRCVLADDAAIRGWAEYSGILRQLTGPASGAMSWPEGTPPGERLAVLEDLYDPWLAGDWKAWAVRIPALAAQVSALSAAARSQGCTKAVIAACGRRAAVMIPLRISKAGSLFSRLPGRKAPSPAEWLPEPETFD